MKLGPYQFATPYILAPMAGVSQMPFRRIVLELGASWAPTELISAEGLFRMSPRTVRYLRHDPKVEQPFCVQLFGGDPERMAQAGVAARDLGARIIDINMGCPVPKVTRNGAGSALMGDPARAALIVQKVREATGLPVTAKIRSGWDSSRVNAVDVARALEQAGAAALAIHPRTRAQAYSGKADWSVIAQVKKTIAIPVIGNGDVKSPADARRMFEETGCDAVMVGRAALGNPWIFRQLTGGPPPDRAERLALVSRHFEEHLAFFGDPLGGVRAFRKPLLWYARGLRGANQFRTGATLLDDPAQVRSAIERFFSTAEPDQNGSAEDDVDCDAAYG